MAVQLVLSDSLENQFLWSLKTGFNRPCVVSMGAIFLIFNSYFSLFFQSGLSESEIEGKDIFLDVTHPYITYDIICTKPTMYSQLVDHLPFYPKHTDILMA